LTLKCGPYVECYRNDLLRTEVVWFLEQLFEEIRGRIVGERDNVGIHRSFELATFPRLNRRRLAARRLRACAH